MIDTIVNFAFTVIGIPIIIVIALFGWQEDSKGTQCGFDCEHCQFTKCYDEQIERCKENDLHNR